MKLKENVATERRFLKDARNVKFKNKFNEENPKRFKEIMRKRRLEERERNPADSKNPAFSSKYWDGNGKGFKTKFTKDNSKKIGLFNYRNRNVKKET